MPQTRKDCICMFHIVFFSNQSFSRQFSGERSWRTSDDFRPFCTYLLVMSLSWAEGFSARLRLVTISFQLRKKIWYFGQSIFSFLCSEYFFLLKMTDFLVQKFVKLKKNQSFKKKKLFIKKKLQLGFSSKIEVPQLGLTGLGNFSAWLGSALKILARTYHYLPIFLCARKLKCNYKIRLNIRFSHLLQGIEE